MENSMENSIPSRGTLFAWSSKAFSLKKMDLGGIFRNILRSRASLFSMHSSQRYFPAAETLLRFSKRVYVVVVEEWDWRLVARPPAKGVACRG